MKKTIVLTMLLGTLFIFAGCSLWQQEETTQKNTNLFVDKANENTNEVANTNTNIVATNYIINNELTIYQNNELGFSLNYPVDWTTDESLDSGYGSNAEIAFFSPEIIARNNSLGYMSGVDIMISVFDSVADLPNNPDELNLSEWIQTEGIKDSISDDFESITINDIQAFKFLTGSQDAADTIVYLERNKEVFMISIQTFESDNTSFNTQRNNQYNQILQSFKFIN